MDIETRELFIKLFAIERLEINFKTEIKEIKAEIIGIKKEIIELKTEMTGLKNEQSKTNERLDALSSLYGFHEVAI